MQFEAVYSFFIDKLEKELPHHLTYHNPNHTREVIKNVQRIAKAEKVNDHQYLLLSTAALFHDAGFLESYANHEERSCDIARIYLPQYEYTEDEIDVICRLILVTKVPQMPVTLMEKILCDADLYYLGTDKFAQIADNLYSELKEVGLIKSWKDWQQHQIEFLETHNYFTNTVIKECGPKKAKNLSIYKARLQNKKSEKENHDHGSTVHDVFLILFGVLTAGFALKGFLVPNHFFDGGVTGTSLLVHELTHFNLSIIILLFNLPLIILGYIIVSKKFAYKTLVTVLLLGLLLQYFPYPIITTDKLLISIFGGFFLGLGSGLIMRGGCALDGIEVLALYTWKRTSFTVTEIIMGINIIIFSIAAFKFGIETSLYSVLVYFTATRTIDYVVEGVEAYTGVTIISGRSEIIKNKLVNELGRSITIYKGERGYLPGKFETSNDCDIIFTVITRLELRKLKNMVYETDPAAFVFANTIKEASGGILKRRHSH